MSLSAWAWMLQTFNQKSQKTLGFYNQYATMFVASPVIGKLQLPESAWRSYVSSTGFWEVCYKKK